jgi:hypothetical protein
MRPRVFVSSVMDGFEEYRHAARSGVIAAGGDPVLVEDFPSLPISSRTACLDGVASSDIYIGMVGKRGGWTAPSGKLVVEEEFEEARRCKLRTLAFIQDGECDEGAARLVRLFSDYIAGMFRQRFSSAEDLQTAVERALAPLMEHYKRSETDHTMIEERLKNIHKIQNHTTLRTVLVPERQGELIDPVALESPEVTQQLFEIAHSRHVGLFSFEHAKTTHVGTDELVMLQSQERRSEGIDEVRLEVTTSGALIIDINVTGGAQKRGNRPDWNSHVIVEGDVNAALKRCFAFAREFYHARDPYQRYDRLFYNAALAGLKYKTLMPSLPAGNNHPMSMRVLEGDRLVAFDRPRLLTRQDLINADEHIQATLVLFRRRLR